MKCLIDRQALSQGLEPCDVKHDASLCVCVCVSSYLRWCGDGAVGRGNQSHLSLQQLHDRPDVCRHATLQPAHSTID